MAFSSSATNYDGSFSQPSEYSRTSSTSTLDHARFDDPFVHVVPTAVAGYDFYTAPPAGLPRNITSVQAIVEQYEQRRQAGDPTGQTEFLEQNFVLTAEEIRKRVAMGQGMSTIFQHNYEAQAFREALRKPTRVLDPTLPQSDEEERTLVKGLFIAFKSIRFAEDKEGVLRPFKEERHVNEVVEAVCWQLLVGLQVRSTREGPLLVAWEPERARRGNNLNFAERYNELVNTLWISKTVCRGLYQAPKLNAVIDDPRHYHNRVMSNRKLNESKAEVMAVGKKAMGKSTGEGDKTTPRRITRAKKLKTTPDSDEDDDDLDGDEDEDEDGTGEYSTPPSRQTRTQSRSSRRATKSAHRAAVSTSRVRNQHVSPQVPAMQDLRLQTPTTNRTRGAAVAGSPFGTPSPIQRVVSGYGPPQYGSYPGQPFTNMIPSTQFMPQPMSVATMAGSYDVMANSHNYMSNYPTALQSPLRNVNANYQAEEQGFYQYQERFSPIEHGMHQLEPIYSSDSLPSNTDGSGDVFVQVPHDQQTMEHGGLGHDPSLAGGSSGPESGST